MAHEETSLEKHVRHLRQASMLTRSRERKPREHESHVSSRQVRKEMVYQKGCFPGESTCARRLGSLQSAPSLTRLNKEQAKKDVRLE